MAGAAIIPSSADMLLSSAISKRKTPSELRLEQLKRLQTDQTQSFSSGRCLPQQKKDASKSTRFVDTRVPDIYAATKPGDRPTKFLVKDKKALQPFSQSHDEEESTDINHKKGLGNYPWKTTEKSQNTEDDQKFFNASNKQAGTTSFSSFRDVTQISNSLQKNSTGPVVDMVKAFKGMSATKVTNLTDQASDRCEYSIPLSNSDRKFTLSSLSLKGEKYPLDLSLKTNIRFISTTSLERFHRVTNKDLFTGIQSFLGARSYHRDNYAELENGLPEYRIGASVTEALHSWVHPQSVLPSSVLSALASSAARGATAEKDFLSRRQQMWEDAFRSLYYMFRNGQCGLFYFCTQQFYAMFISRGFNREKEACSAYITRSTRGLRALLQEQDIGFHMPLCSTGVETTLEEIQELTEFEKSNPGQTRLVDSMVAVDNSPQSMLAFNGHKNVHGLYDFLLNHRCLLSSTTGQDVPVLFSPVTFENASLVTPEVVCKKLQCSLENKELCESANKQPFQHFTDSSFVLELKESILPPWVIWRVSAIIQKFHSGNLEASLITDPLSIGLNIAQDFEAVNDVEGEHSVNTGFQKEFRGLKSSSKMKMAYIKHFNLLEGEYVVDLSAIN